MTTASSPPANVPESSAVVASPNSTVVIDGPWTKLFENGPEAEPLLRSYLSTRRWFRGKSRRVENVSVISAVPLPLAEHPPYFCTLRASFDASSWEDYVLLLAVVRGAEAEAVNDAHPGLVLFPVQDAEGPGLLCDALARPVVLESLLDFFTRRFVAAGPAGELRFESGPSFSARRGVADARFFPKLVSAEQTNTSVIYGDSFILKLFRRLDTEQSPDVEIGHYLTDQAQFAHAPAVAGAVVFASATPPADSASPPPEDESGGVATVAILHRFVANKGDAWEYIGHTLDRLLAPAGGPNTDADAPQLEASLGDARLLGRRTAELHVALGGPASSYDAAFRVEAIAAGERKTLAEAAGRRLDATLAVVLRQLPNLPPKAAERARQVLARRDEVASRLLQFAEAGTRLLKCRIHGDLHLGQILFTGDDFIFIDFEGEPLRSMAERKAKRSPLADVAGVVRSFHYAALGKVIGLDAVKLGLALSWYTEVKSAYLSAYLERMAVEDIVPPAGADFDAALAFYILEKCIYEIGYEVDNRPDWLAIPLNGLLEILDGDAQIDRRNHEWPKN